VCVFASIDLYDKKISDLAYIWSLIKSDDSNRTSANLWSIVHVTNIRSDFQCQGKYRCKMIFRHSATRLSRALGLRAIDF